MATVKLGYDEVSAVWARKKGWIKPKMSKKERVKRDRAKRGFTGKKV